MDTDDGGRFKTEAGTSYNFRLHLRYLIGDIFISLVVRQFNNWHSDDDVFGLLPLSDCGLNDKHVIAQV
jgi:hypothetical protein